ncbi:Subtilase family protein [Xanthomonas sp. GW]|uniref:S8/S53 family peptidase n=1 Tax=Xanthomonas sp. GW TaxID=2724121 RepID=UPI00163B3DB7|nr:S8/S53 family peptidase [Xanthomonas sp. GW]QNH21786.1 Subtilase family protein [Xanthomonas sp. GW]
MKKTSTDLLLAALLMSLATASAHAQTQTAGGGKFPAKRMLLEAGTPRSDAQGRRLYAINLNPFVLQETERLYAKTSPADFRSIDPAIRPHQNSKGMVHFADQIARMPGVKIERVLSTVSNTVYAWMPERVAAQLARIDYVVSVRGVEASAATFSAAGDSVNGAEIASWALPYTNTNDAFTTSNPVYLLDAVLDNPPHPELNVVYRQDSPSAVPNPLHSTAVAGLVGARQNGQLVRGVNPGQPIKAFGLNDLNEDTVATALDAAARYADGIGEFAVLNMSFNTYPGSANWFASSQKWGRRIRAASNRFFITQSAGNAYTDGRSPLETDACKLAYDNAGTARDMDGIVVVGGLQRDGSRFGGAENSAQWGGFASGSTVGPCIEAWAPAHEITNLIYSGGTEAVSGTSFAAPIVAAIASRYGDSQTRPIEREAYIKAGLAATGYSEAGLPLKKVQYVAPAQFNIPKRLPVVAATSPTNSANLVSLYDGKFFSDVDYWNAQTNWGSVTLDLGQLRTVTGVRITVRTAASDLAGVAQPIDFAVSSGVPGAVFGGSTGGGQVSYGTPVYYTEADQSDVAPVYIALSGGARYLKIEANNPYSWLAYSEIEIYGY